MPMDDLGDSDWLELTADQLLEKLAGSPWQPQLAAYAVHYLHAGLTRAFARGRKAPVPDVWVVFVDGKAWSAFSSLEPARKLARTIAESKREVELRRGWMDPQWRAKVI